MVFEMRRNRARSAHETRGDAELAVEIDRSRRYNRPFALVGILATDHEDDLRAATRSIDRVWRDDGCVFVLLPESNREIAERMLERLRRNDVVNGAPASVAVFPDDGLTTRALVSLARPERAVSENNGFGRHAADLTAALRPATGDAVVTRPAD